MAEEYPLDTYRAIAVRYGFDDLKVFERYLLLERFGLLIDKIVYELAMEINEEVRDSVAEHLISKHVDAYKHHMYAGGPFYLSMSDKDRLVKFVVKYISDDRLAKLFEDVGPRYDLTNLGIFRGGFYRYEVGGSVEFKCSWDEVFRDTLEALDRTKERGYAFLSAIIKLYKITPPTPLERYTQFYGPSLHKILQVAMSIVNKPILLIPNDYVILKAYRIYYKSGSKRHPGHSVPIESIPGIEKALQWYRENVLRL